MTKHFGPQHLSNNYAGMGNAMGRPYYKYAGRGSRTIQEAIARERAADARARKMSANKKKKK